MPRPFKPLRELDIEKVADDMAASITKTAKTASAKEKDDTVEQA